MSHLGKPRFGRALGTRGRWTLALIASTAVLACSSDDGRTSSGCVPGRAVECATVEGCQGAQVCAEDGTYESCHCGAQLGEGGSVSDSGGSSMSSGGSAQSGGAGGSPPSTQGKTGGSSTNGGAPPTDCAPVDMSEWNAPPYVPAVPAQSVCSTGQIQAYHDNCLIGSDCSAFEPGGAHETCGDCLLPDPLDANRWGPVLELSPKPFYRWETNTAGCQEQLGNTDCARKIQAAQVCARQACLESCGATSAGYEPCVREARTTVCSSYEAEAVCIPNAADAAACSGDSFEALVVALGEVFCG